uniref:CARDB domain-containing protein n=1 Tax=uncultured Croceitalea sp. TaxID=1798908 RepID=UPI0033067798
PDSTPNDDDGDQSEDDEDNAIFGLQSADLSLNKTVSPTTASIGETVTFSLEVSNAGTDDSTGVSLEDIVPDGYTIGTINNGGIRT